MSLTPEQARDEVLSIFQAAWDAGAQAAAETGSVLQVEYPNLPLDPHPREGDAPWARVTVQVGRTSGQTLGSVGGRRFGRVGQVVVQLFVREGQRGLVILDRLAKVAADAFEGSTSSEVWFRRVDRVEVGADGLGWYQLNVSADLSYEEVK